MKEYLRKLVKNNGVARGWLYVVTTLALTLGDDMYEFGQWLVANRDMLLARDLVVLDLPTFTFLAGGKVFLALGAALNTLRAYLDQHLSKTSKNEDTSDTTVTTKS